MMWYDYGRKIINAIFKKRSDSTTIRAEFGSKLQADSDRSDIRVFETGLSIEQYGNYEQSTGTAAQESESARIVAIAKRKRLPSGESIVFINDREDVITKIRNPFAKSVIKGLHAYDVIYEHLIHNILFPNSCYKFIGISEDS